VIAETVVDRLVSGTCSVIPELNSAPSQKPAFDIYI